MDTTNSNLLGIARRLADTCAAAETVQAVAVTGSVAAGTADDASDIDLLVLHSSLPPAAVLSTIREAVNGSQRLYCSSAQDNARFKEGYFADGVRCDLSHLTLAALEEDLALVLEAHSTDAHAQSRVSGIQSSLALYGGAVLSAFQQRASCYPAALARIMVRNYLRFQPFWAMTELGVKRRDLLYLYQTFVDAEKSIIGVLCGLNSVYLPGDFKHTARLAAQLPIAPENLAARLAAVFQQAPEAAASELGALIRETFALVEQQMPDVDTSWPRHWFDLPRTGGQ